MRGCNIDKCQFTRLGACTTALLTLTVVTAAAQTPASMRWEPFKLEVARGEVVEAERGRLTVPERRGGPPREIEIAFVRLGTSASSPGAPLLYLDGGPGGPGYTVVRIPAYLKLFNAIRETRDVILLSQRGIGLSQPVPACPASEPLPADVFLSIETMMRAPEPRVRTCGDTWREKRLDLTAYNTEESADDVEALRRALGVPQVAVLGFSYGTHLGLSMLRRHPGSVERAILAGVEGPSHTWKLPTTFDVQFARLSKAAGVDLVSVWRSVLARASSDPFRVSVVVDGLARELRIGAAALQYFVRRDIGDTNDWPWIPTLVTQ
ncbi:MAG: alpha/beta fold hydrolase, partial [Vicinamibacterales bacterium]